MSISQQRIAIIKEIGELEIRAEKGENVTASIRHCGKRLEALGKLKKRKDTMDANSKDYQTRKGEMVPREILDLAESNGISREALLHRISVGWDKQRAATTPVEARGKAKDFGISVERYKELVKSGMLDREISTQLGIAEHKLSYFKKVNGLLKPKKRIGVR